MFFLCLISPVSLCSTPLKFLELAESIHPCETLPLGCPENSNVANRFLALARGGRLLELPAGAALDEIRQPCHSMRRLILPKNDPVIGERLLNRVLELMPNLVCLIADIRLPVRRLPNLNHRFVGLDFSG